MSSWDWKRTVGGVQWADVWEWLDQIRTRWRLWGQVTIYPPLPSCMGKEHGSWCLTLTRHDVGEEVEQVRRMGRLPDPKRTSAEAVILQEVVKVYTQLDVEQWEAERAGRVQGLLF